MAQYELDLREYWRIARKRKAIIFLTFILITAFTFLIGLFQRPTPIYEATASVKVEKSSSLVGLLTEVVSWTTWDNIATQAIVIRSYPVMENVAKRLGLIPEGMTSERIREHPEMIKIISDIQKKVKTTQKAETNIINIAVRSKEPEEAKKIANTVAEVYREQSINFRNRQVKDTRRFIESQLKIVEKRLKESEVKLKEAKQSTGIISDTNMEVGKDIEKESALEAELQTVEFGISEVNSQLELLVSKEPLSVKIKKKIFTPDPLSIIYKLNSQLTDLMAEKNNLLIELLPTHPQIKEIDEKIENIFNEIIKELKAKLNSLQMKKKNIEINLGELKGTLYKNPDANLQLTRLQREVAVNNTLYSLLKSKHQEALIKEAEQVEEVSIVKPAFETPKQINPSKLLQKIVVGGIIGLLLGLVLGFVVETLDTSIGTIEDVESYVKVPVFGVIPDISDEEMRRIITEENILEKGEFKKDDPTLDIYLRLVSNFAPSSILAESYRALRTNIQFSILEHNYKTLLVTSASLAEGKTSAAINLAISLAQLGKRVLLVEADLRRPIIHKIFGLDKEPGLSEVLIGNYSWKETTRTVTDMLLGKLGFEKILHTPGVDNLNILTSGSLPPNPSEFLNSHRMDELIEEVKGNYDIVIFDTPPVLPVTDAVILGSKVDGVLLVYKAGNIARSVLRRAKLILDNVRAKVIGVVLIGFSPEVNPEFFKFSYQTYTMEKEEFTKKIATRIQTFISKLSELFSKKTHKSQEDKKGENILIKIIIVSLLILSFLLGIIWQGGYFSKEKRKRAPAKKKIEKILKERQNSK